MAVKRLREEVRFPGRGSANAADHATSFTDALAIGVTSIADIDKLMEELQIARDYLQSEGERVRLVNAHYGHMAKTASASAKIIAEKSRKMAQPGGSRTGTGDDAPSTDPSACR